MCIRDSLIRIIKNTERVIQKVIRGHLKKTEETDRRKTINMKENKSQRRETTEKTIQKTEKIIPTKIRSMGMMIVIKQN